jgi:hypothetical protein
MAAMLRRVQLPGRPAKSIQVHSHIEEEFELGKETNKEAYKQRQKKRKQGSKEKDHEKKRVRKNRVRTPEQKEMAKQRKLEKGQ